MLDSICLVFCFGFVLFVFRGVFRQVWVIYDRIKLCFQHFVCFCFVSMSANVAAILLLNSDSKVKFVLSCSWQNKSLQWHDTVLHDQPVSSLVFMLLISLRRALQTGFPNNSTKKRFLPFACIHLLQHSFIHHSHKFLYNLPNFSPSNTCSIFFRWLNDGLSFLRAA